MTKIDLKHMENSYLILLHNIFDNFDFVPTSSKCIGPCLEFNIFFTGWFMCAHILVHGDSTGRAVHGGRMLFRCVDAKVLLFYDKLVASKFCCLFRHVIFYVA